MVGTSLQIKPQVVQKQKAKKCRSIFQYKYTCP